MQDMTPDMTDLMRKAAEAYPLKEMDDRWDEITSKINTTPALPPPKAKRVYKRYFVMLLFLLMFSFTSDYFLNHGPDLFTRSGSFKTHVKNIDASKRIQSPMTKEKTSGLGSTGHDPNLSDNAGSENSKATIVSRPVFDRENFSDDERKTTNKLHGISPKWLKQAVVSYRSNDFSFELHDQPVFLSQNSKQKSSGRTLTKGFYYGLVAGPAFNSVKEQSLKTGWNFGIIGGYYVSRGLSLETGVIISQKSYSTSGDYFSMKEIGAAMPPPMKVMEVDGKSKVIEIPIHIRYDIFQNRKRSISSLVGFSSYLLSSEDNQYHTSTNGTMQMMYGTYKNDKHYFAASLDLGIGYTQNFWKYSSIRVQPYVEIPIRGIGVGHLQVMSTGLRIALIKRVH